MMPSNLSMTGDEKTARKLANMKKMEAMLTYDQKKHYKDVPKMHRLTYLRAHTTNSKKAAIEATCNQCFGYEELSEAIPECSSESCPLWQFRKGAK